MIEYREDGDLAVIDGYKFRRDKKTGYYLSTREIGGKRKRLHVYIWETNNGPIPAGYEVHHKDYDKTNNNLSNYELLSSSEHTKKHAKEMTDEARTRAAQNLVDKALPKACEWHKSEAGREWHKVHYAAMKEKLHPVTEYFCTECGDNFLSYRLYGENENRFCCNNCKSAYRRRSGVDNIERECACCGEKFITNKYSKARYCEKHRRKGSHT